MIHIHTIKNEMTFGPFDAEYLHAHVIETLADAVFKSPHQLIYIYRYNNKWHLETTDYEKLPPAANQIIRCQHTDVIDKLIRNIYIILALLTVFFAWIYATSPVSAP